GDWSSDVCSSDLRVNRSGQAFEFFPKIYIVIGSGAALVIGNLVSARDAKFATINNHVFLRMAGNAQYRLDELVNIVDEVAAGGIDQFHGAIATACHDSLSVHGPGCAENPVTVVI